AWDDPQQAELLELYLAAGDNEVDVCLTPDGLLAQLRQAHPDAVLLSATFPASVAAGLAAFPQVPECLPRTPVILACRPAERSRLPRFLNGGLRSYLIRDEAGDFAFLALTTVESAVDARRADEARKLAERLREEMDGVRRLQESIIPQGIKPPPGYRIAA